MKKVFTFLLFFLHLLVSGIFIMLDENYNEMLNIPAFALPPKLVSVVWIILYILISISIYMVSKEKNIVKCSRHSYCHSNKNTDLRRAQCKHLGLCTWMSWRMLSIQLQELDASL